MATYMECWWGVGEPTKGCGRILEELNWVMADLHQVLSEPAADVKELLQHLSQHTYTCHE